MAIFESTLAVAASGMEAQSMRLRLISENIANADTPGYHRKLAPFEAEFEQGRTTGTVRLGDTRLDDAAPNRLFAPGHPMADGAGYVDGSNVNVVVEIADAREAQRSYEANLRVFDQARQMTRDLLDLLRR